ncbi:hypothetical protein PTSG_00134 [Salpingoeca rosetta]|uniref:Uncharacterized protein n=1 Tax=Salpingoeca rosetta (strain ATCC 50818 / BSB-021) TaxID=946362 RepID=F2TVM1_SALR5|nr:uncharacterized protein PTSG_00134 [Salpingoeca rosetta]EGD72117.1 hypothetical protein PTSG_00134 [Salpingoeca rosetta]|eukprot:XP_004998689.1 hypothetical protein PTSG_00134 [Salpingoeca rosetta]
MSDKVKKPTSSNGLFRPIAIAASGVMGIFFGIAMEKARVFEPMVIRDQMVFSRFIMVKMFLSAVVAGQLGFLALSFLAPKKLHKAREEYACCVYRRGLFDTAIGAAMLGAGMTVAGACPGMVIIQAGSMVPNAAFTIGGLLFGTYIYASVHDFVVKFFHRPAHHPRSKVFLDQVAGVSAPVLFASMSAALATIILVLEYFFPWTSEVPRPNLPGTTGMMMHAWSPVVAGAIVGSLQIPAVVFIGDTLGSSTSYVTVCAQPFEDGLTSGMVGYLSAYKRGTSNWWQVVYIGCAALGAYISSSNGIIPYDATDVAVQGVPAVAAFLGGILMIFGSRMAGGCTSFVAVPAMNTPF